MPRSRILQTTFNYGELDPLMMARSDTKAYKNGCKQLSNWWLLAQGGIRRRPGTAYVATVYDGRLVPFEFSDGQEYVFVFSNTRLDIFTTDGVACSSLTGCPWSTAQLFQLGYTQSGDTLIVTHKDIAIQKIVRTGALTFTRSALAFETHSSGWPKYMPFFKYAANATTLTPSATTGAITLTTSAAHWTANHVGLVVRHKNKQIEVTGYTSTTVVNATVRETLTDITATTEWDEEAFSVVYGYPQAVVFHEDRMWFGGAKNKLTGVWGSKIGAYFNFDLGTAKDNEAVAYSIQTDQIAEVQHFVSHRHLQIFTTRGEFFVVVDPGKPITPTNFAIRRQTPYGSSAVKPSVFDGSTIFVQKTGTAIREFLFDYLQNSYDSNAVSLLSTHLLTGPRDMAVMYGSSSRPEQFAYVVNTDGSMAVYSSVRAEKLAGWVPWTTNGLFRSVTVVGSEAFTLVKRTINGSTVYLLERFDPEYTLDCAVSATGASSATWTGLGHLNGIECAVTSGNYYMGVETPSGGSITLDSAVTQTQVGLNYTPTCETLPPTLDLQTGSILLEPRRIARIKLLLDSSLSLSVNGTALITRQVTDDLSLAPDPITREVEFFSLGYSKRPTVTITQEIPLDLTILALTQEVVF